MNFEIGATPALLTAPAISISAHELHGDDTPVQLLVPGNGKTKTGRLWTYVRDDRPVRNRAAPAVWFAYSPEG